MTPFEMTDEKPFVDSTIDIPSEETPSAETEIPSEPPKPGEPEYTKAVQRRIDQITREKHEERRRAEQLRAENEALKRRIDAGARPVPPDPGRFVNETTGEIDRGNYQKATVEYEDTLHTWRQAQERPSSAAPDRVTVADDAIGVFMQRSEPMRQKHEDFEAVINRPVFTPELRDAVFESDTGPELAYFLGKNESEAMRIGNLPPAGMMKEIGKLEMKFSAEPGKRSVSGAPEPITPVTGTATVAKDPEKMSTAEWMAYERERQIQKLKKEQSAFGG